MTVAAFMDLALYDSRLGYYARAAQRSGRAGDFFTSVDVGPLFGDLLERQIAEMSGSSHCRIPQSRTLRSRRSRRRQWPALRRYPPRGARAASRSVRPARVFTWSKPAPRPAHAHAAALGGLADRQPAHSSASLPESFEGVLIANELLDALPVHQVVMREDGLREVFVASRRTARLTTVEAPPSTPALAAYLARLGVALEPGWRAEINLRAVEWVRDAGRRLRRGFSS